MDTSYVREFAVVTAAAVMLFGLRLVFQRLKEKNQGFGTNSLRALGMVLFIPSLIVVGVSFPGFNSETIAALFGTVAGYVLSQATKDLDA